jgi:hypothetical protein
LATEEEPGVRVLIFIRSRIAVRLRAHVTRFSGVVGGSFAARSMPGIAGGGILRKSTRPAQSACCSSDFFVSEPGKAEAAPA